MGCFDTVEVPCPEDGCNGMVEFQSKGGDCYLATFDCREVPLEIAADCDNGWCNVCEKPFEADYWPKKVTVGIKR